MMSTRAWKVVGCLELAFDAERPGRESTKPRHEGVIEE